MMDSATEISSVRLQLLTVLTLIAFGSCQNVLPSYSTTSTLTIAPTKVLPQLPITQYISNISAITPTSALTAMPSSIINITTALNSTRCIEKTKWKASVYDKLQECLSKTCAKKAFDEFDSYMDCNDRKLKKDRLVTGGYISKYAVKRGEEMIKPLDQDEKKDRTPEVQKETDFDVEYGYIRSRFLIASDPMVFSTCGRNEAPPCKSLRNKENYYLMPPTMMTKEVYAYAYTEFSLDIYKLNDEIDFRPEQNALSKALFLLEGGAVDEPLTSSLSVANVFNSKIITVITMPLVTPFIEYVDIVFQLRDYKGTINHKCVHGPGHLGQVKWTNDGCYTLTTSLKTIHCRCNSPVSNFAVLSELFVPPAAKAAFQQEGLTLALVVICAVGILVCFLCLILPPCVGCSYVGGMIRIYRYSDLTQALEYIIFIIGVYARKHEVASALIAVVLHFLHCSVMFWALVEGIYLYHKVKPQFHRSTGTMFFYSTMVFGISAALTGAAAGYDYNFGTNIQYAWVKASGTELIYFLIPVIVMLLITIAIDWILIMQQKNWIGFQDDYVYTRTPYFIQRQSVFILVCIISSITGAMSMSKDGTGTMAYLFAAFFVLQFVCRFYSHFIWNFEVWEWKKFNDAYVFGEKAKVTDAFKMQAKLKQQQQQQQQHTTLLIGGSESGGASSSEEEDGHYDDVVEVDREYQRPASVRPASAYGWQEVEERAVTPKDNIKQVTVTSKTRPSTRASTVENIAVEEEKEDEVAEVVAPVWKDRKPSIQPRMTKGTMMRRQSVVQKYSHLLEKKDDEKKDDVDVDVLEKKEDDDT